MRFKVASALLILIAVLALGFVKAASEIPQLEWSKTYYGVSGCAIQTADGGYAIAGNNASMLFYPAWERAPTLIKTDALGELQWNKTFEATGHVATSSIMQTTDGGYVLSGSKIAPPTTSPVYSGWVIKTDEQGNIEWKKTIEMPLERCYIIQTSDESYVLTGYTANNATGTLTKLDKNGDILWNKTFGEDSSRVFAYALLEANDGGYVVVGSWAGEGWLMKTDSDANVQWSQTYPLDGSNRYLFRGVAKTSDAGYVLAGGKLDKACLIKTDSLGNMDWNRIYPATGSLGFNSVVQTAGGYIAVSSYNEQVWIVKLDANGNCLGDAKYGDIGETVSSFASSVVVAGDGGFVVAGALNNYSPTTAEGFQVTPSVGDNVWLAKFAPEVGVSPSPTVPEFPTWAVQLLLAVAVFVSLVYVRRKQLKTK